MLFQPMEGIVFEVTETGEFPVFEVEWIRGRVIGESGIATAPRAEPELSESFNPDNDHSI